MRKPTAGELLYNVAFDKKGAASDGAGGTTTAFTEQFSCRAAYVHLRGGESVQAARLQGQHPQVIRVRSSSHTRGVTTDWRIRDKRTGDVFNIRDITPGLDRQFIDFLCQKGVAP
ncbi:phage head closure protein [Mesorhizobium atlanticum]|uniref:Head-tail adaptor protein n=1 Tax=Mesorhizobium atlanticum TaxID=2233532 RepID=A0A330GZT3_9HYPH|nr:phage head closure protein [Mesorhizobium atlanticum]RAZ75835.1 head-tail adaptor protein [Mesorhizobium atlanticum]